MGCKKGQSRVFNPFLKGCLFEKAKRKETRQLRIEYEGVIYHVMNRRRGEVTP